MPRPLVPHRSGAHRLAAIALYRALLTQCRALPFASSPSLPLAEHQRDELQNIVRHRFKQSRFSQSARHLRISFDAGYEALDHLDASVAGDAASSEYISELLQRAPERLKTPPPVKQPAPRKLPPAENDGKPRPSIFDRPLPLSSLSGPRHVPILVNANAIPMLRIKKPQPLSLSGYINHRIHKRQVRNDRRSQLLEDRTLAAREDEWDDLLDNSRSRFPSQRAVEKEPEWVEVVQGALDVVRKSLERDRLKNKAVAEKMQGVVDREQALFDKEQLDRKSARREEKRRRKKKRSKRKKISERDDFVQDPRD